MTDRQLTLGQLLKLLEVHPSTLRIRIDTGESPGTVYSYRGYYEQLAFEPEDGGRFVGEVVKDLRSAIGKTFTGYKGGEYRMHSGTPLWVAEYGCCGRMVVGVVSNGSVVVIQTAEDPW